MPTEEQPGPLQAEHRRHGWSCRLRSESSGERGRGEGRKPQSGLPTGPLTLSAKAPLAPLQGASRPLPVCRMKQVYEMTGLGSLAEMETVQFSTFARHVETRQEVSESATPPRQGGCSYHRIKQGSVLGDRHCA